MKEVVLEPKEEIIAILKPSSLAYTLSGGLGLAVFASTWLFLFPLVRLGISGVIIFLILLGASAFWMVRAARMRSHSLCMVTSERLIHVEQLGLFGRSIREIKVSKLKAKRVKGSYFAGLFGLSTVSIRAQKRSFSLQWMAKAGTLVDFLNEVQWPQNAKS